MPDRVSPLRPDARITHPEFYENGLLDRVLGLRGAPDPAVLLMGKGPRQTQIAKEAWAAAIDASLDLLVPTLKKIAMLTTPANHGPNCINGAEAKQFIGRVPLTRTDRGWRL